MKSLKIKKDFNYHFDCPCCGAALNGHMPIIRKKVEDFREVEIVEILCCRCGVSLNLYFQRWGPIGTSNLDNAPYSLVGVEKASSGMFSVRQKREIADKVQKIWIWSISGEDKLTVTQDFAKMVCNLSQDRIQNLDSKLLHAVLGIGTEAGEVQDLIKKNMFYGEPFDILTLKEELSDLLHYIQMGVEAIDSSLEEITAINIAKLTTRYPNGYIRDKALVRDKTAERIAMEKVEKEYHG